MNTTTKRASTSLEPRVRFPSLRFYVSIRVRLFAHHVHFHLDHAAYNKLFRTRCTQFSLINHNHTNTTRILTHNASLSDLEMSSESKLKEIAHRTFCSVRRHRSHRRTNRTVPQPSPIYTVHLVESICDVFCFCLFFLVGSIFSESVIAERRCLRRCFLVYRKKRSPKEHKRTVKQPTTRETTIRSRRSYRCRRLSVVS
jgi:hypothetical protein